MKAILVNADGTVREAIGYEGGKFFRVEEKCSECGGHKRFRMYEAHFASNANTRRDGVLLESAWGQPNDGTMVLVERPT